MFSVFRRPDGLPGAFLADQQLLHRLRATTPLTVRTERPFDPGRRARIVSPDGRYSIEFQTTGRIDVVDPATNRLIRQVTAPAPPPGITFQGVWFAVTDDSTRLLVVHTDQLVVYALPDLTVRRRIDLPVPPDLGAAPATDLVSDRWATSVLAGAGDDVLVLHAALLTRWDIGTGARISEPVPLRPGDVSGQRRSAQQAFAPARRPGRPGQVAVVQPNGLIQIWDLDERRMMTETQWDTARTQKSVVFTPDGSEFAATSVDGLTGMWSTAAAAPRPGVFVTGQASDLLGFTPQPSNLVTVEADGSGVRLWDPSAGQATGRADRGTGRRRLDPQGRHPHQLRAGRHPHGAARPGHVVPDPLRRRRPAVHRRGTRHGRQRQRRSAPPLPVSRQAERSGPGLGDRGDGPVGVRRLLDRERDQVVLQRRRPAGTAAARHRGPRPPCGAAGSRWRSPRRSSDGPMNGLRNSTSEPSVMVSVSKPSRSRS